MNFRPIVFQTSREGMVYKLSRFFSAFLFFLLIFVSHPALGETNLLRFPDIYQDKIVFCYAGDLWLADVFEKRATRLTAHSGQELFPKFSPDGKWIAFTGQYDGDEQVYVTPSEGGIPRQLTFYPARGPVPPRYGSDHQVFGWTRDGQAILFRSQRYAWHPSDAQLFTVQLSGGLPEPLPMPQSGAGDFSPDGKKMVYSPLMRDFRTWNRYQGGWAQNLAIFDLENFHTQQITHHPRTDRDPMWIKDKIYFTSDRDGKLNLYSYDPLTQQTQQITQNKQFDVRWPSSDGQGQIIYELNGRLHLLDIGSGFSKDLSILVPNDGVAMRPSRISAEKHIVSWGLSPKGKRSLFSARGDIFSAPIEKGPTRNLTQTSGAHDKWPQWSPDGKKIVFVSDRSGEEEIYLVNQDGSGELEQITEGGKSVLYYPQWSPDGKHIVFGNHRGSIYVLELLSKKLIEVAHDKGESLRDYTWSPNGGHLAFSLSDETGYRSLYIWEVQEAQLHRVTDSYFSEFEPVWDPKGDYLFYLSIRRFDPQRGALEQNYVINREIGIYALALRRDVKHPFPLESDEVITEEEGENNKEKKDQKKDAQEKAIQIHFEGLSQRVVKVPVPEENYRGLSATEGHLLYFKSGAGFYGRGSETKPSLQIFSMKDRKVTMIANGASGYQLSLDGKKVMVRQGSNFYIYDAKKDGKKTKKRIMTKNLRVNRIPSEEWAQIFDEVWRRYRDFFYVENMHGYDWEAIRQQYRPLLKYVAHRSDLNYLLGQMVGELNVSHAYVSGGYFNVPPRRKVALAGLQFEKDKKSNRYRIGRIYQGHNAEKQYRAPLTEIGVGIEEGEYLLAIDGQALTLDMNPYQLLLDKADQEVAFLVNHRPVEKGARKITFHPINNEKNLLYFNWVAKNRAKVSKETDGRVGYLHIPDMGASGIREFAKWFYGQTRKGGLIIDVRGNGGGHVSQMLIERLRRQLLALTFARNKDKPNFYPSTAFPGHLVCLLNETSGSDGDIFPAMFREAGLGPLIGKRSWGGVVGIRNHGALIDGGSVFVPEFGFASKDGRWVIENHGVDPDIEVENDPEAVIQGRDPQLERAIQEITERMAQDPRPIPQRPPDPIKTESIF